MITMERIVENVWNEVANADFVETPMIRQILRRAVVYLECGYAVNFSGPAGTGKTTLALRTAKHLGRPTVMVAGDEELTSFSMVGGFRGVKHRWVDDNYIRSVHKIQDEFVDLWVDNRLTSACERGHTMIYDEFTRSRPETNNLLLSVLEERVLHIPMERGTDRYLQVHPDFRMILTSNPGEYAGVFQLPDALRDRVITVRLDRYDLETEWSIVCRRSGLGKDDCRTITQMVRQVADNPHLDLHPSLRAGIMIARAFHHQGLHPRPNDALAMAIILDVLAPAPDDRDKTLAAVREFLTLSADDRTGGRHAGRKGVPESAPPGPATPSADSQS